MVAPTPPNLKAEGNGRFSLTNIPAQAYYALVAMIIGTVGGCVLISTAFSRQQYALIGGGVVFILIGFGVGFFLGRIFKCAKIIIDFQNRQILYCVTIMPQIFWTQPTNILPIDKLSHLEVHDTGVKMGGSSGRRGRRGREGAPVYEIRIAGNSSEEFIPLCTVSGHYNITPVMSAWTLWLQDQGIAATNNAAAVFGDPNVGQLQAISASPPGSPYAMQSGQHAGVVMSPVATFGQPAPDNIGQPSYYGAPPPPPPGQQPGFTNYDNMAYQQQQPGYGAPPPPPQAYQQQQPHPSMPNVPPGSMNYQAYQ